MQYKTLVKVFVIFLMQWLLIGLSGIAYGQLNDLNKINWRKTTTGPWISDGVEEIVGLKMGPFIRLDDGSILTVDDTKSLISQDEGKTWEEHEIFEDPSKFRISNERGLLQTSNGIVTLAFMNLAERHFPWEKEILDAPGARLPTYTARSLDGGKTWRDVQKIHNDYTGAIRTMMETQNGSVVFTSMMLRHNPAHNAVVTYASRNDGKDWERSTIIDVGGIGHHSGVMEGTFEQLSDGNLWMLMRTNWGIFWQATSEDNGLKWKDVKPTAIWASSAPGLLKRLKSGRLILLWNQLYPEGKNEYTLNKGGSEWSEIQISNHREELSMAFSDDEGKNWSDPVVIAKVDASLTLAYPYLFEPTEGELWITTIQGNLRIKLNEKDFIK